MSPAGWAEVNANEPATKTPAEKVNELGAKWSPDFDDYAAGRLSADQVRCVLCGVAPCDCPSFGTPEYLALVNRLHGR